ncbi:MAG: hypothetical protein ACXAAQ_11945 [Candidatus Thorarchaeota archaeon]|jgi:hypothetical protein
MSQQPSSPILLFEESRRSYLGYKSLFTFFLFYPILAMYVFFHPESIADNVDRLLLVVTSIGVMFLAIRLGIARKRFRIFEDRIALALPIKFFPDWGIILKGQVLFKDDIESARLDVLSANRRRFIIKVITYERPGTPGDWRAELMLKNDPKYLLDSWSLSQISGKSKKEILSAVERFLAGIQVETLGLSIEQGMAIETRKTESGRSIGDLNPIGLMMICATLIPIGGYLTLISIESLFNLDGLSIWTPVILILIGVMVTLMGIGAGIGAYRSVRTNKME